MAIKNISDISLDFNNQGNRQINYSNMSADNSCPICGGSGLLLNENDMAVPCSCWLNKIMIRKRAEANILPAFAEMTFENFSLEFYPSKLVSGEYANTKKTYLNLAKNALTKSQNLVDNICQGSPQGSFVKGLLFQGQVGSGKTHLAAAIANKLITNGIDTLFIVVPDFLDEIRRSYSSTNEYNESDIINKAKGVGVLILDDLGSHNFSEWTQNQIFSLINHRLNCNLPCVVTTNLSLDSLIEVFGKRTISRLIASCEPCLLPVPEDIRFLKRQIK